MEKTIDYAEEYLQLKNKEMWHKAETYAQLKNNSLKEKAQFNDFVNFKVKQGRKQLAEEYIQHLDKEISWFEEHKPVNYNGFIHNLERHKGKIQKEVE